MKTFNLTIPFIECIGDVCSYDTCYKGSEIAFGCSTTHNTGVVLCGIHAKRFGYIPEPTIESKVKELRTKIKDKGHIRITHGVNLYDIEYDCGTYNMYYTEYGSSYGVPILDIDATLRCVLDSSNKDWNLKKEQNE